MQMFAGICSIIWSPVSVTFSHCCKKVSVKCNKKKEGFIMAHGLRDTSHHGDKT